MPGSPGASDDPLDRITTAVLLQEQLAQLDDLLDNFVKDARGAGCSRDGSGASPPRPRGRQGRPGGGPQVPDGTAARIMDDAGVSYDDLKAQVVIALREATGGKS